MSGGSQMDLVRRQMEFKALNELIDKGVLVACPSCHKIEVAKPYRSVLKIEGEELRASKK